jgi:hypothetical protein
VHPPKRFITRKGVQTSDVQRAALKPSSQRAAALAMSQNAYCLSGVSTRGFQSQRTKTTIKLAPSCSASNSKTARPFSNHPPRHQTKRAQHNTFIASADLLITKALAPHRSKCITGNRKQSSRKRGTYKQKINDPKKPLPETKNL